MGKLVSFNQKISNRMFAMISKILELGWEQVFFGHNFWIMCYLSVFHIQKQYSIKKNEKLLLNLNWNYQQMSVTVCQAGNTTTEKKNLWNFWT